MLFASTLLVFLNALSITAMATGKHDTQPMPPQDDPWYTAPYDYEYKQPGTILRIRAAPGNLSSVMTNATAAFNILYRTTDSRYLPSWAVTTLFIPKHPKDVLLSYQIPYDSVDLTFSPSYQLYQDPPSDISRALGLGWYVNVPDYEGPLGSFTAGVMSGHATLDSIRAVKAAAFGLTANAKYAMWGYSGGALASEWAAELQLQYAPELKFSGAALGGLTPNVTSVMLAVSGKPAAGLIPLAMLGLTSQFPEAERYLLSRLKKQGAFNRDGFLKARNYSSVQAVAAFANQDIADYFIGGFSDITAPPIKSVTTSDGQMGYHGVPQMPLYVYKAVQDEVSPTVDTDALVSKYCKINVAITYVRNPLGGHFDEWTAGVPGAMDFLQAILTGTYYNTGCKIMEIASSSG
ncbi:hypothetical protein Trihar35433_11136 [Trichoderma harzianum]|nr:hypothetical protein Trihar35433_11136 [Trichoderma harzianum]